MDEWIFRCLLVAYRSIETIDCDAGSSADNADNPEVGDEILEVNGRTLENATDAEVSQYIHQVKQYIFQQTIVSKVCASKSKRKSSKKKNRQIFQSSISFCPELID